MTLPIPHLQRRLTWLPNAGATTLPVAQHALGIPVRVSTVAALRALPADRAAFLTLGETEGYWEVDDGGAAYYRYDAGSTANEDGVAVLVPTFLAGRFLRVLAPGEVPSTAQAGLAAGRTASQNSAALAAAIQHAAATTNVLDVAPGIVPLTTTNVGLGVRLRFAEGAIFEAENAATVTLDVEVQADEAQQVFRRLGTGTFALPRVRETSVHWFGAVGDGATDDRAAIQLALDVVGAIRLLSGFVYDLTAVRDTDGAAAPSAVQHGHCLGLRQHQSIRSEGLGATLRLKAAAAGQALTVHIFKTAPGFTAPVRNVRLLGPLTIDGNFGNQSANGTEVVRNGYVRTAVGGLDVEGNDITVERVRFVGMAAGSSASWQDAAVCRIRPWAGTISQGIRVPWDFTNLDQTYEPGSEPRGSRIIECVYDGSTVLYSGATVVAADMNFSAGLVGFQADRVRDCEVYDLPFGAGYAGPDVAGCVLRVRGSLVSATAPTLHGPSGWRWNRGKLRTIQLRDNRFHGVRWGFEIDASDIGAYLYAEGGGPEGGSNRIQSKTISIEGNIVEIAHLLPSVSKGAFFRLMGGLNLTLPQDVRVFKRVSGIWIEVRDARMDDSPKLGVKPAYGVTTPSNGADLIDDFGRKVRAGQYYLHIVDDEVGTYALYRCTNDETGTQDYTDVTSLTTIQNTEPTDAAAANGRFWIQTYVLSTSTYYLAGRRLPWLQSPGLMVLRPEEVVSRPIYRETAALYVGTDAGDSITISGCDFAVSSVEHDGESRPGAAFFEAIVLRKNVVDMRLGGLLEGLTPDSPDYIAGDGYMPSVQVQIPHFGAYQTYGGPLVKGTFTIDDNRVLLTQNFTRRFAPDTLLGRFVFRPVWSGAFSSTDIWWDTYWATRELISSVTGNRVGNNLTVDTGTRERAARSEEMAKYSSWPAVLSAASATDVIAHLVGPEYWGYVGDFYGETIFEPMSDSLWMCVRPRGARGQVPGNWIRLGNTAVRVFQNANPVHNPYLAGLTPYRVGEEAFNSTAKTFWKAVALDPVTSSWALMTAATGDPGATGPNPPTAVSADTATTVGFTVDWTEPASGEPHYQIEVRVGTEGVWYQPVGFVADAGAGATVRSQVITGLLSGTAYSYRVRSMDFGSGLSSAWVAGVGTISTTGSPPDPGTPPLGPVLEDVFEAGGLDVSIVHAGVLGASIYTIFARGPGDLEFYPFATTDQLTALVQVTHEGDWEFYLTATVGGIDTAPGNTRAIMVRGTDVL